MRVKLKNPCFTYSLPKGYEFEVVAEDDGFWTNYAFYQGWITMPNGHKVYASFDQDECEVLDWS